MAKMPMAKMSESDGQEGSVGGLTPYPPREPKMTSDPSLAKPGELIPL